MRVCTRKSSMKMVSISPEPSAHGLQCRCPIVIGGKHLMATLAVILVAYVIGSISFAVVVSKLFRLPDPHSYGSGNPGATNVLRTGNKAAAALTLIGDGAKGWVAVFLARQLGEQAGVEPWTLAAVALAVFLGHLFPVFHKFSGGKGVA